MIENGIIYKYTNLINGKVYIGQTTQTLQKRDKKHMSQIKDDTYFHRALKKYGRENFSLEIIEDNIPFSRLDEREKYYIKIYDSLAITGKGYNLTIGGKWGSSNLKLTSKQADEIIELLEKTKMRFIEIANCFNVSIYTISDINNGKSFINKEKKYPIRKTIRKTVLNNDEIADILELLKTTDMPINKISSLTGISAFTIGNINRGNSSYCPKDLEYPIRRPIKKYTHKNKLKPQDVVNICHQLCFSSKKVEDIASDFHVAKNTISDISRGLTWKEITSNFICPIRKNQKKNQEIYLLTYGIV